MCNYHPTVTKTLSYIHPIFLHMLWKFSRLVRELYLIFLSHSCWKQQSPNFDPNKCCAFQFDITSNRSVLPFAKNSLDFILMVFVLSAVSPTQYVSPSHPPHHQINFLHSVFRTQYPTWLVIWNRADCFCSATTVSMTWLNCDLRRANVCRRTSISVPMALGSISFDKVCLHSTPH